MITLSPRLCEVALTATDRILLRVQGVLIAMPPVSSEAPVTPCGRPHGVKSGVDYGRVKQVAEKFVAGEFPGMNYVDVGQKEKVDAGSLRCAVWKLRKEKNSKEAAA